MTESNPGIKEILNTYKVQIDIPGALEENILGEIGKQKDYHARFKKSLKRAYYGIIITCFLFITSFAIVFTKIPILINAPSLLPLIGYSLIAFLSITVVVYILYSYKTSIEKSAFFNRQ